MVSLAGLFIFIGFSKVIWPEPEPPAQVVSKVKQPTLVKADENPQSERAATATGSKEVVEVKVVEHIDEPEPLAEPIHLKGIRSAQETLGVNAARASSNSSQNLPGRRLSSVESGAA